MKYTKQGVRDLSDIGSKKPGSLKLDMPPLEVMCNHKGTMVEDRSGYFSTCSACGFQLENKW